MSTTWTWMDTPIGALRVAANDNGLCLIEFPHARHPAEPGVDWHEGTHPLLDKARLQLEEYFAGMRRVFDLPLAPRGTDFQCRVWAELGRIPYGTTLSYAQLATRIGKASAIRAVGAANGRNPLPIVVPCHRVIGADGSLTGFGGGLPTKQFLLQLESAVHQRELPAVG